MILNTAVITIWKCIQLLTCIFEIRYNFIIFVNKINLFEIFSNIVSKFYFIFKSLFSFSFWDKNEYLSIRHFPPENFTRIVTLNMHNGENTIFLVALDSYIKNYVELMVIFKLFRDFNFKMVRNYAIKSERTKSYTKI